MPGHTLLETRHPEPHEDVDRALASIGVPPIVYFNFHNAIRGVPRMLSSAADVAAPPAPLDLAPPAPTLETPALERPVKMPLEAAVPPAAPVAQTTPAHAEEAPLVEWPASLAEPEPQPPVEDLAKPESPAEPAVAELAPPEPEPEPEPDPPEPEPQPAPSALVPTTPAPPESAAVETVATEPPPPEPVTAEPRTAEQDVPEPATVHPLPLDEVLAHQREHLATPAAATPASQPAIAESKPASLEPLSLGAFGLLRHAAPPPPDEPREPTSPAARAPVAEERPAGPLPSALGGLGSLLPEAGPAQPAVSTPSPTAEERMARLGPLPASLGGLGSLPPAPLSAPRPAGLRNPISPLSGLPPGGLPPGGLPPGGPPSARPPAEDRLAAGDMFRLLSGRRELEDRAAETVGVSRFSLGLHNPGPQPPAARPTPPSPVPATRSASDPADTAPSSPAQLFRRL